MKSVRLVGQVLGVGLVEKTNKQTKMSGLQKIKNMDNTVFKYLVSKVAESEVSGENDSNV